MRRSYLLWGICGSVGLASAAMALVFTSTSFRVPAVWVGGSGGAASSASFRLTATLGQSLAGTTMNGSTRRLGGGFLHQTLGPGLAGDTVTNVAWTTTTPDAVVTLTPSFGTVEVTVPAQAFSQDITFSVNVLFSFPALQSRIAVMRPTNMGVLLSNDQSLAPVKPISLAFRYRTSDISGLNEDALVVARYDAVQNYWIPLQSSVDPVSHNVSCSLNQLGIFRVVEVVPASNITGAFVYPNPFRPSQGHTVMRFANLPADARLRIYTLSGEEVNDTVTEPTGMARWNGNNKSGQPVASGVYLVFVQSAERRLTFKVAVER